MNNLMFLLGKWSGIWAVASGPLAAAGVIYVLCVYGWPPALALAAVCVPLFLLSGGWALAISMPFIAHWLGSRDQRKGVKVEDCPFDKDEVLARAWIQGWGRAAGMGPVTVISLIFDWGVRTGRTSPAMFLMQMMDNAEPEEEGKKVEVPSRGEESQS